MGLLQLRTQQRDHHVPDHLRSAIGAWSLRVAHLLLHAAPRCYRKTYFSCKRLPLESIPVAAERHQGRDNERQPVDTGGSAGVHSRVDLHRDRLYILLRPHV